ncbi:MAG TPA: tetratricopeptide repeat protein [Polyangiaceae bacterium]|nr:tetratricopeptide repeat protein [Polyangiaceae bacterium]
MDFVTYATQPDDELDLLEGALLIAGDARPGLDHAAVSAELEALAAPLRQRGLAELPAPAQARVLADHLFVGVGFHGNDADYYDPKNSFLDEVIARRTGIPISLSVVYVEVARRAGVMASPVGFPGHFLVRIDDPERRLVVDPFHGGGALDEVALADLLRRSGSKLRYSSELIAPTPVRQVVARMLMNLRGIYASRGDFPRLLVIIDRLIDLMPASTDELRERGYLLGRLGAPRGAVEDLGQYVERLPHADDADEVKRWMARLTDDARSAPSC